MPSFDGKIGKCKWMTRSLSERVICISVHSRTADRHCWWHDLVTNVAASRINDEQFQEICFLSPGDQAAIKTGSSNDEQSISGVRDLKYDFILCRLP